MVLTVLLIGGGIFSERGLLDWRRMVRNNHELQLHTEAALQEKEDLLRKIKLLKTSPFDQKQAVRQILGYVSKDEVVIEF